MVTSGRYGRWGAYAGLGLVMWLLYSWEGRRTALHRVHQPPPQVNGSVDLADGLQSFMLLFDENNLQTFSGRVISKFPHLKTGDSLPIPGNICERFSKQPTEEKLVLRTFWGPKSIENTKDVSFVTQLSYSKLDILALVLGKWKGPVSASLYVTWSELNQLLAKLLTYPEFVSRTNVALHVVLKNEEFYPVNFLRNLAANSSLTQYMFLADVDFVPSVDSYEIMREYVKQGQCDGNKTLVVPAFEFFKMPLQYPPDKGTVLRLWDQKELQPFHWDRWEGVGHWSTDYYKWKNMHTLYQIIPTGHYEPYLVMNKADMPFYREIFQGRIFDKISYSLEVIAKGFRFLVLPNVFCIHMPHPSVTDVPYEECSRVHWAEFQTEMREKYPNIMTDYIYHPEEKIAEERRRIEQELAEKEAQA